MIKSVLELTPDVRPLDRVRTKTGKMGVVRSMNRCLDTANVMWDDGEEFLIRVVHLEVMMRNATLPAKFSKKLPQ